MGDTRCPTCWSDDPRVRYHQHHTEGYEGNWYPPHDDGAELRSPTAEICSDPFHDTTDTRPEEEAVTPLAGLAGYQCGCDGSRPCGEPNECVPARFVACSDCQRNGTEDCLYPYDRLTEGCYFAIDSTEEAPHA